jgi:hypothetical protein
MQKQRLTNKKLVFGLRVSFKIFFEEQAYAVTPLLLCLPLPARAFI